MEPEKKVIKPSVLLNSKFVSGHRYIKKGEETLVIACSLKMTRHCPMEHVDFRFTPATTDKHYCFIPGRVIQYSGFFMN